VHSVDGTVRAAVRVTRGRFITAQRYMLWAVPIYAVAICLAVRRSVRLLSQGDVIGLLKRLNVNKKS